MLIRSGPSETRPITRREHVGFPPTGELFGRGDSFPLSTALEMA